MMLDPVAAFLTSVLFTGLSDRLGKDLGIIDFLGRLKLQARPVSRLGGLGIFCSVMIGLLMLPPEFHVALQAQA